MDLTDVRRLTGTNLIMDRPGAVGEAELPAGREGVVVALWREHMRRLLEAVGWGDEIVRVRPYPGGASLAVSAPPDALYVATDLVEWAWEAAASVLSGGPAPDPTGAAADFRERIEDERNPRLLALAEAARDRGLTFLCGEDEASVGLGTGCRCWSEEALPAPEDVDWQELHDVPVGLG